MSATQSSPLSFSAQIGRLIPAVDAFERERSCDQQALAKATAQRMEACKQARILREQQFMEEILADVREHPGSRTNDIAKRLPRERSFTFRLLRQLEAEGQVAQVGSGKILRWEAK